MFQGQYPHVSIGGSLRSMVGRHVPMNALNGACSNVNCGLTGDIAYLKVLGQSMVVLDTFEAASEFLDRRSSNYSDRPRLVMNDL